MATRIPLVFVAGELVECPADDTIDITNINITNLLRDFVINVKDFGAKGDGTTDDIQAFREALAEATAKNTVVYIPYGSYNLSESITGKFITFGHVTFSGSGSASPLTDVYDDFVHKNHNIAETVTGNKSFTGITDITTGDIHTRKLSGTTVNAPSGACNLASGTVFLVDATTANKTISFNTAPVGNVSIGVLIDKGENQTVTWPANVKWAQGYDLELVTGKNFIKLYSPDSGNSWYGISVTQPINIQQFLDSIIQKIITKVLEEITNQITELVELKDNGGLARDDEGIYINVKPEGGIAIENNQVYVDLEALRQKIYNIIKDWIEENIDKYIKAWVDINIDKYIKKWMEENFTDFFNTWLTNNYLKIKLKYPSGLIQDNEGFLYINLDPDGGLEINSENQLKINFDKIKDIVISMIKPDGGLVVDVNTKQIYVDFTQCNCGGGGSGSNLKALLNNINSSSIGDTAPTDDNIGKCLTYNGNNEWTWTSASGGGLTEGDVENIVNNLIDVEDIVYKTPDQTITGAKTFTADTTTFTKRVQATSYTGVTVAVTDGAITTSSGSVFTLNITGGTTISITATTGVADYISLIITGGGTNITWPSNVHWNDGEEPELSEGTDVVTMLTPDGSTWYATLCITNA